MTKQLEALIAEMKTAAEKATPLQLDTAQLKRGNDGWIECPCCEGDGSVEAESDFCNIDGKALGVQFYGIGEHHGLAEQYFRQVTPADVLSLIAALEQSQQTEETLKSRNRRLDGIISSAEKRIAELESTLELEREKSRRVMSQNHQLPTMPDEREAFESFMVERFGESIDQRRAKNGDNEYMAWDKAVAWTVWQHRASMTAAHEYPEFLPCPVLLEPGLRLGAGIKTSTLLEALSRRAGYYARLEAMTPEEREEHDAGIAAFKALLDGAIAAAPAPEVSGE